MARRNRTATELRTIKLTPNFAKHAEGSCLVQCGDTHVLCTATVEEKVPPFMRNGGKGWVTAEYGMLPRATHKRVDREAQRGKQTGRTHEIQRLIGRSLRSILDPTLLGERTIKIDCDVLQADGGTRTASITGGYVALHLACRYLVEKELISQLPLLDTVAAISCGIVKDELLLDLDYEEDSTAETDANFIITGKGTLVEVQATAEGNPFSEEQLLKLLALARSGINQLKNIQLTTILSLDKSSPK